MNRYKVFNLILRSYALHASVCLSATFGLNQFREYGFLLIKSAIECLMSNMFHRHRFTKHPQQQSNWFYRPTRNALW